MDPDLRDQLQRILGQDYRLTSELSGGGGMARVFIADDASLGRRVVVKVLLPELAAAVNVARFKREIQVAAHLQHPNIVPVLSAVQTSDLLYYTMPFVGSTLRSVVEAERQLALDDALRYACDVAAALTYAHAHNVVHRDIKPENILVDHGRALVSDFGIARAIERAIGTDSVTTTGLTLGTPTYMSPEQAAAEKVIDGRSDVYSLACVLYEMLTGDPPFVAANARTVIAKHIHEPPPSIRTARPDVPEYVDRAVMKAMAKSPAARFALASEFAHALVTPTAAVGPIVAETPATRHPWLRIGWIAAAVVVVAAAVALFARARDTPPQTPAPAVANRVAVLYIEPAPGDSALATIARGLSRDLTYRLQQVPELQVISEAGVRGLGPRPSLDSVAKTLDVGTVVTGSIERIDGSLQVDLHLVDARTGVERAAVRERYAAENVLSLRDTVTDQVSRQLLRVLGKDVQLQSWRAETHSRRAWELRAEAQDLLDHEAELPIDAANFAPQIALLNRADSLLAIAASTDPGWPEPVVARGWIAYERAGHATDRALSQVMDSAMAIARTAERRWPGQADVLELRGSLEYRRWANERGADPTLVDSALIHLQSAIAANPQLARAWSILSAIWEWKGDGARSTDAARRALALDPFERSAGETTVRLVFRYLFDRQNDSARALCARARQRYPRDAYVQNCELTVLGYAGHGDTDIAASWRALSQTEQSGYWPLVRGIWPPGRFFVAAVLARSGLGDSARHVMVQTREMLRAAGRAHESEVGEAQVRTLLGEPDSAIALLESAVSRDPAGAVRIARLPWFDPLRSLARFQRIIHTP